MTLNTATTGWQAGAWDLVARLGHEDGSARHGWLARLAMRDAAASDLADAVHTLCAVHGGQPGVADAALADCAQPDACEWLGTVAVGFEHERAYIAALAAAVGPTPSTPAQSASETAMAGVRHALDMMAHSGRRGCATGAVAALVHDWAAIRGVLDAAARRFGVDPAASALPPEAESATLVAMLGATPATERAITFGAQQLYAQHRGLWDLLEARSSARG